MFFNDAKAAGFAELWNRSDLTDAFYILLSQHVGGAMIRNHQVELGENTRAGEIGHMTMIPFGKACYCGRSGCLEPYCSSAVLSELAEGDLDLFFRSLRGGDPVKKSAWDEYLNILSMAVNNINMLLDCPVILGGSVGVYLEEFMGQLRSLARDRNSFSDSADYLACCQYKVEPIAAGAALPFIDEFIRTIDRRGSALGMAVPVFLKAVPQGVQRLDRLQVKLIFFVIQPASDLVRHNRLGDPAHMGGGIRQRSVFPGGRSADDSASQRPGFVHLNHLYRKLHYVGEHLGPHLGPGYAARQTNPTGRLVTGGQKLFQVVPMGKAMPSYTLRARWARVWKLLIPTKEPIALGCTLLAIRKGKKIGHCSCTGMESVHRSIC